MTSLVHGFEGHMFGHDADLQPLPVERAAGLTQSTDAGERFTDVIDPDPAALQLEKRSLLASHRGTVSEDFPDAPHKQQRRYFTAAMFCLVATLLSADQNLLAPNLTAVARDFNFTDAQRDKYLGGVISAAFFLLGAPAALLIGYLSDTMNRAKLLFWVVLLGEGPCLLTYFVTSYWQLFVLRALTGISIGGCLPLVFNLLGDLFDAQHRANVLSGVLIATGAGTAIGQALAGLIGPATNWRWPFVIVALPSLFVTGMMLALVQEPPRGITEPALQAEFAADANFVYSERITMKQSIALLRVPTNMYVFIQGLFGCLPWGVLLTYLTDYLAQDKGLSVPTATMVTVFWGLGGGVGAVGGGALGQWLYNNISKASMPLFTGITVASATLPMWWLTNANLLTTPIFFTLLLAVTGGMLSSTAGPLNKVMLLNVNEPETRGVALAWQSMTDDLGKGLGPALVAALISALGRQSAFNVAIAGWLPCGALLALVAVSLTTDEAAMQARLAHKVDNHIPNVDDGLPYTNSNT